MYFLSLVSLISFAVLVSLVSLVSLEIAHGLVVYSIFGFVSFISSETPKNCNFDDFELCNQKSNC